MGATEQREHSDRGLDSFHYGDTEQDYSHHSDNHQHHRPGRFSTNESERDSAIVSVSHRLVPPLDRPRPTPRRHHLYLPLAYQPTTMPPTTARTRSTPGSGGNKSKPSLNMSESVNPSQWLNFSLPPRQPTNVPGSGGGSSLPRRSKRGEGWRGSALSRERYVHASFRFVLKPTEMVSYGAHLADPDM